MEINNDRNETMNINIIYSQYTFSLKQKIIYSLIAAILIFLVSYIFYRSILICVVASFLAPLYLPIKKKELIKQRKNELLIQFREFLTSISSSLNSGKSLENALIEAYTDLKVIFPEKNTYILVELYKMISRMKVNQDFIEIFCNFAARTELDDIQNFSEAIAICKKRGGNIAETIRNSAGIISGKLEIQQDIDVILSKSRFETKILNIVPPALVLMLSLTSWEYMEPIFTTFYGRITMTVAIILLVSAYFISHKISNFAV